MKRLYLLRTNNAFNCGSSWKQVNLQIQVRATEMEKTDYLSLVSLILGVRGGLVCPWSMASNWSAGAKTSGGLLVSDESVDAKTVTESMLGVGSRLLVCGCWFCIPRGWTNIHRKSQGILQSNHLLFSKNHRLKHWED